VVVGADIAKTLGIGGIAIGGNQVRLAGDLVQKGRFIGRVYWADGNATDARGDQIIDILLLRGDSAVTWLLKLDIIVWQFFLCLCDAFLANRPIV
jgi:hypothetical protein